MIEPEKLYECLLANEFCFFAGVPDSTLKEFCLCLKDRTFATNHIIAANEGNAVALCCGHYIATGKTGVVYMQNSGIGNAINPMLSLTDKKVYSVPILYMVGYRGEPGIKDEPQHITQGELTLPLFDTLGIKSFLLNDSFEDQILECREYMNATGKSVALIVKKDMFLTYKKRDIYANNYSLTRESALETILSCLDSDEYIVSTTGKTSREIYEIRERSGAGHGNDFLTVGSMGHSSSLALGISLSSKKNIYCIDGDGSFIMHMGALAVAIQNAEENYKYILINNGCHESVGRQPTIAEHIDIEMILKGFGFEEVLNVKTTEEIIQSMSVLKENKKTAMIVYTNPESRKDLGRPLTSPIENRICFENKLRK